MNNPNKQMIAEDRVLAELVRRLVEASSREDFPLWFKGSGGSGSRQ
jgi:hypothetical protein